MKKTIAIILAVVILIGIGVGVAYKFLSFDKNPDVTTTEEESLRTDFTVNATYTDFQLADEIFEFISENPERWSSALVTEYGMSEEERDNLIEDAAEWLAFTLYINVENPNDNEVLIHKIECANNGKDKIYVQNNLDGISQLDAKSDGEVYVNVLMHNPDPSLEEVYAMVKEMGISVYASVVPTNNSLEISDGNMIKVQVK